MIVILGLSILSATAALLSLYMLVLGKMFWSLALMLTAMIGSGLAVAGSRLTYTLRGTKDG